MPPTCECCEFEKPTLLRRGGGGRKKGGKSNFITKCPNIFVLWFELQDVKHSEEFREIPPESE